MQSNYTDHLSSWGLYPKIKAHEYFPFSEEELLSLLKKDTITKCIPRGLGRSYGDSSLASKTINSKYWDHFLNFNEETGILECQAGLSLDHILSVIVPKGWFLPVTPGTKFISIGGAIASDVHGKNHHIEGCFSEFVKSIKIVTPAQGILECSPKKNSDLFYASCGGMGLTGMIIETTIQCKRIQSAYIEETNIKAKNLKELLDLFEEYKKTTYTVAWIDCLEEGKNLGRGLFMAGEHASSGKLISSPVPKASIPIHMPNLLLNRYSIQIFNALYYHTKQKKTQGVKHYDSFFYPLDSILHWNRLYGKNGFTQYQFVIPKEAGWEGMYQMLSKIIKSKRGSFLAVLKVFGKENENYLSFPKEGYTLALDFKIDAQSLKKPKKENMKNNLFSLLRELDKIVLDYGGRVYLTKDVCLSKEVFRKSYPKWKEFMKIKNKYDPKQIFSSLQSERIGLTE